MTEPLPKPNGLHRASTPTSIVAEGKTVIAIGPGLGRDPGIEELVQSRRGGASRSPWCWMPMR